MNQTTNFINCPNCGHQINVNEILYSQLQNEAKSEYGKKLAFEKTKIETLLREQISEEKSEEIKSYQEQLSEKIQEAKGFHKMKADFVKLQREKDELKEKIQSEFEEKLTSTLEEEKRRIKKDVEDKVELKINEKEFVINQLKEQLKQAQRKAEQGSMQIQGEVQEIAIEEFLRKNFPLDKIEEVKKGARGADCLHIINTRARQNCGSIYYESKRTKEFRATFIEKFKQDMLEQGAIFGVIVTDVLPKEMERFGQKSNVWLCTFDEFKGLCFVLREAIILFSNVSAAEENKSDKISLLYDFLTGHEFRMQIEAIVDGFSQLQIDLLKEKRAMDSIWKQREKQIQKVLLNTTNMYSTIRGIAGNAVGTIKALELPNSENTENEN